MNQIDKKVALVTGASSGIGKATALALQAAGFLTVATAREINQEMDELKTAGCEIHELDVTNENSRATAVRFAESFNGAIYALVNNAGYGQYGPIEEIPLDAIRQQFETNVFGLIRLSQLVLPGMRRVGAGRIINVSSVAGEIDEPGSGIYHATKHAVEAIDNSLRMEVEAFGIDVVGVLPGPVVTNFADVAVAQIPDTGADSPYFIFKQNLAKVTRQMLSPESSSANKPEDVAAIIATAATAAKPSTSYHVGTMSKVMSTVSGLVPDRVWDAAMKRQIPADRLKEDSSKSKKSVVQTAALTGLLLAGAGLGTAAFISAARSKSRQRRALLAQQPITAPAELPADKSAGALELVHEFHGSMPTGVSVSQDNRIFVNYPRWGDPVPFTVAEIVDGEEVAFPNEKINRLDLNNPGETFVSVQSIVIDPKNRLWILDTGAPKLESIVAQNAPKLIGIDLATDQIFQTIHFPPEVVHSTTYLNDIRFDLRHGADGIAYITDSSDKGANGIIVVDLASGKSWRKLNNDQSTKAEPEFMPFVEGQPVMQRKPGKPAQNIKMGADGIAISADGARLYYCPLASRRLYSVSTAALRDSELSDAQTAATVRDEGEKPASDGLETDAENNVYCTAYETNGIVKRRGNNDFEIVVHDNRLLWPDTMSLAADGYLYFTANQLHRQSDYNNGKDQREKPYSLFRVQTNARPVQLR